MEDVEDPHDLAFPSAHFARQSVVDNLVMSLDRVSPSGSPEFPHIGSPQKSRHQNSSETRRTQKETMATIHGTDEDDSYRTTAYGAPRAAWGSKSKAQERSGARSRSSSNSSSVDLGHLTSFSGRLGPAGNRRSQSFDFGSQRPSKALLDSFETPPSPRVFPMNRELQSSSGTQNVPQRKNSGRSAKSAAPRTKRRSGTVGASIKRVPTESPQALPPIKSVPYETTERRLPPTPTTDISSIPSRPGFFKRVFGSSKNTPTVSTSGMASPLPHGFRDRTASVTEPPRPSTPTGKPPKQSAKTTTDQSAGKEPQQVVTKKPSSFFRRRKKSASSGVPPPLPLTLNSLQAEKPADAPSPVSSLKALMDPYLATDAVQQGRHGRGHSIQSINDVISKDSVQRDVNAEISKAALGHSRKPSNKSLTKLHIPIQSPKLASSVITGGPASQSRQLSPLHSADEYRRSPVHSPASEEATEQSSTRRDGEKMQPHTTSRADSTASNRVASPTLRRIGTRSPSFTGPLSGAGSDVSIYKSAPSTPIVQDNATQPNTTQVHVHVSHPSIGSVAEVSNVEKAKKLFQNPDDEIIGSSTACAWLGESGSDREGARKAYMELFDWSNKNILAALRSLCGKMVLKAEAQQVDRIIDAFSYRWCACNANHGFKSNDVVHTICYSVLLLNTDLHLADIGQKMTRTQFIKNAMVPIRQVVADAEQAATPTSAQFLNIRSNSYVGSSLSAALAGDGQGRSASALSSRPSVRTSRDDTRESDGFNNSYAGPLVEMPYTGSMGGWELQVESVLKEFYVAISREPLPLFGQTTKVVNPQNNSSLLGLGALRRTPSTLSKAHSESRSQQSSKARSLGFNWARKSTTRMRLGSAQPFGTSRTSLDDGSSNWSPMSSTWSKVSLVKTLTSMSVDSFATEHGQADYQSSIGFANALSQAIIRDEQLESHMDEGLKATPLLEDESLELQGAPWAKEGMLKHKCHLEGVNKRSKDRNWNDCFAVIEKGWMRLFSFSTNAKTVRNKARAQTAGGVVGGGNWQDNAEEVWKFMLRHTIASTLPPPGYSKLRPFVWALSLPNGAVHLFSVGTPDIVKEFVSTANFWSARLSKEPIAAGVSSMEYGWSDNVINRALVNSENHSIRGPGSPRPSTQMSLRSSLDHGSVRPKLPGDKVHISEWNPPQQSLTPSQLMEVDQHKALQTYVKNVEDELTKHNELRPAMLMAFSARHPNSQKAMANWEKKSSYLLREIVKFSTYIDALNNSQKCKQRVYKMREEDQAERAAEKLTTET